MAILFGTKQISRPTPASINTAVRVFTIAAGIFLAWMSTSNLMGPQTKDVLNQILGLALGLVNGLAPLFGVDLKGQPVSLENVTAIAEKKG